MDFKKLSDSELESTLQKTVLEENKLKTNILHLLAEVERRRLYSKEYPSLFEYCVKTLKYSSAAAQRRIDSMRAMRLIPELETKILSGDLNLSSISQAQSFFRQEAKSGKSYSVSQKKEVLQKLENKSSRDCLQTLIAISPQAIPVEKRRTLTSDKIELKVVLDQELITKLDQIKAYLSHKNPSMTDAELLKIMAEICIEKLDPTQRTTRATSVKAQDSNVLKKQVASSQGPIQCTSTSNQFNLKLTNNLKSNTQKTLPASEPKCKAGVQVLNLKNLSRINLGVTRTASFQGFHKMSAVNNISKNLTHTQSRYISAALRKEIYLRDQGCCTYLHPTTHARCNSKRFLEIDHIRPFALGGQTTVSNLRLLCRTHNQWMAVQKFGVYKIIFK